MATKNNISNRGGTLVVYCPKCKEALRIVKKVGCGPNGLFWSCTKCDFEVRHKKGDYVEYENKMTKK
jgi:predicted RNA-binding Zn-ribbon protein involved in translation (DUF1610 family)